MNYPALKTLDAQHTAAMTPAEAAVALNAMTTPAPMKLVFGSFRTIGALLTATEYNTLRAVLKAAVTQEASAGGSLYADMEQMLLLPGDEDGNGGGLDLGNAAFVASLAALCSQSEALAGVPEKVGAYVASKQDAPIRVVDGIGGTVLTEDIEIVRDIRPLVQR